MHSHHKPKLLALKHTATCVKCVFLCGNGCAQISKWFFGTAVIALFFVLIAQHRPFWPNSSGRHNRFPAKRQFTGLLVKTNRELRVCLIFSLKDINPLDEHVYWNEMVKYSKLEFLCMWLNWFLLKCKPHRIKQSWNIFGFFSMANG